MRCSCFQWIWLALISAPAPGPWWRCCPCPWSAGCSTGHDAGNVLDGSGDRYASWRRCSSGRVRGSRRGRLQPHGAQSARAAAWRNTNGRPGATPPAPAGVPGCCPPGCCGRGREIRSASDLAARVRQSLADVVAVHSNSAGAKRRAVECGRRAPKAPRARAPRPPRLEKPGAKGLPVLANRRSAVIFPLVGLKARMKRTMWSVSRITASGRPVVRPVLVQLGTAQPYSTRAVLTGCRRARSRAAMVPRPGRKACPPVPAARTAAAPARSAWPGPGPPPGAASMRRHSGDAQRLRQLAAVAAWPFSSRVRWSSTARRTARSTRRRPPGTARSDRPQRGCAAGPGPTARYGVDDRVRLRVMRWR